MLEIGTRVTVYPHYHEYWKPDGHSNSVRSMQATEPYAGTITRVFGYMDSEKRFSYVVRLDTPVPIIDHKTDRLEPRYEIGFFDSEVMQA